MGNMRNLRINISDLRKINEMLLDQLESNGHTSIEVESDFYWMILKKEQLYDPGETPNNLGLGQLYDDYEWLENILEGRNEPIVYAFVWLSSIYRYLGETLERSTD